MAKITQYVTSACSYDGAMPVMVSPGEIDLDAATAYEGGMIPFGCSIVQAYLQIMTAPDATSVINVGTSADADHFAAISVATTASGLIDVLGSFTNVVVDPGDVLKIATDGASTGAAAAALTLVLSPNV